MTPEQVERNRAQQAELYGEPLGDLLRRIAETLALTQVRLADVIGLSAPMLSQLISAQRVKIGNPAVVPRVHALGQLADDVRAGRVDAAEVPARIEQARDVQGILTTQTGTTVDPGAGVNVVRKLLRSVAGADELTAAADLLAAAHPGLAELVRVYGVGATDDAVRHYQRAVGTHR